MVYPELPHDVNSPTHPVSAMDYMPVEPLRALAYEDLDRAMLLGLEMSLEEIAEQCFLTSNYLSEIFKEDMGMTLTDYIEQIRMSHAVQALVDGRDPIKDIAVMCGYRSASYFCKRFKDTYGIPATQYRKEESDARRHRVNQVNVIQ